MKAQLGLSLLLLTLATTLYADSGGDEVLEQLIYFNIEHGLDGYEAIDEPLIVLLDEDESTTEDVFLEKNQHYIISIVCDDDCDDVDVWLFNDNGDLVDSDTDPDDTALLDGRPDESGYYTVKIEVSECDSEPCYVGGQVFKK